MAGSGGGGANLRSPWRLGSAGLDSNRFELRAAARCRAPKFCAPARTGVELVLHLCERAQPSLGSIEAKLAMNALERATFGARNGAGKIALSRKADFDQSIDWRSTIGSQRASERRLERRKVAAAFQLESRFCFACSRKLYLSAGRRRRATKLKEQSCSAASDFD